MESGNKLINDSDINIVWDYLIMLKRSLVSSPLMLNDDEP